MKNMKKFLALTCVVAMLVPTLAFAADGEFTGDGIIENDNSPALKVTNVVLPTVSADTYNFTIDAEELFAAVDGENYDANDAEGVWFKAQDEAPQLTIVTDANTEGELSFAKKAWVEDTNLATITAALAGKTSAAVDDTFLADYAVWVPEITSGDDGDVRTGNGVYQILTQATLADYFEVTYDETTNEFATITVKQHTSANDKISNGELYVLDYVALDGIQAATEFYSEPSDVPTFATGLFIKNIDATNDNVPGTNDATEADADISYTAAALGSTAGQVKFEKAVFKNQGTSSEATVVNKSTFDIKVSAKVTVENANALTFVEDKADLTESADDASIYLAIDDETTETAITGTADKNGAYANAPTATAEVTIAGTGINNATFYQTADKEAVTGSHKYYSYLNPIASYNDATFTILAAVDADDDWDTYVDAVIAAGAAPDIKVVYTWKEVGTETSIDATTYSTTGTNTYTINWKDGLSDEQKTIKSIYGGVTADSITNAFVSGSYALSSDKNTLTIYGSKGAFKSGAIGADRYIKVTFGDDTYVILTVRCS